MPKEFAMRFPPGTPIEVYNPTNPQTETDPVFSTWLSTTPPLFTESDPLSLHLDQTTPQTFTAGTVTGSGFLTVSSGTLGLDTATYLTTESDPAFTTWLSSTPPLYPGGWYDTDQSSVGLSGFNNDAGFITGVSWTEIGGTQSDIYVSGFYNDSGYLTYWDTIYYAENAGYASYSDSSWYSSYSGTADYCNYESDPYFAACPADGNTYGVNNGAWTVVAGDTTFTQWRTGTAFSGDGDLVGPCQFDDVAASPTKYARYWNVPNSSLCEWWDGTNTLTIGGTSGMSYVAGASDVLATLNGTYAYYIDAGTSEPIYIQNTKDSTDSVINVARFSRKTTGTAADGIGASLPWYLTNDNGDQEIFGQIELVSTDVSDGTEDAYWSFKVAVAGTPTEKLKVDINGVGGTSDLYVKHAVYSDSTTQTITSTSVPWAITFDTVEHEHGIALGRTGTVTITNASPAVVSWTAHGLYVDSPVVFTTDGGLPSGLTAGTTYYVISAGFGTDAFEVSATPQGAAINTSTDGSGTHTGTNTSIITVDTSGCHGFIFSTLCDCTSGNGTTVDIWFRLNGTNIDRSNTRVQIATASNVIISVADVAVDLTAGDKVEMFWVGSSTNDRLLAIAAQASPTRPATPSTILTVKKISK